MLLSPPSPDVCVPDSHGDSIDPMSRSMLFLRLCLPVFVPTNHYRHSESLSEWSTKRLARTSSGGGETVTVTNVAGAVLQSPPSLIDSFSESVILFLKIFKI